MNFVLKMANWSLSIIPQHCCMFWDVTFIQRTRQFHLKQVSDAQAKMRSESQRKSEDFEELGDLLQESEVCWS